VVYNALIVTAGHYLKLLQAIDAVDKKPPLNFVVYDPDQGENDG